MPKNPIKSKVSEFQVVPSIISSGQLIMQKGKSQKVRYCFNLPFTPINLIKTQCVFHMEPKF